jgi:hypothetical protein
LAFPRWRGIASALHQILSMSLAAWAVAALIQSCWNPCCPAQSVPAAESWIARCPSLFSGKTGAPGQRFLWESTYLCTQGLQLTFTNKTTFSS